MGFLSPGGLNQERPDQANKTWSSIRSKAKLEKGIEWERKKAPAPYLQTTIGGRLRPPIWLLYVRLIGRSLPEPSFSVMKKKSIWNGILFHIVKWDFQVKTAYFVRFEPSETNLENIWVYISGCNFEILLYLVEDFHVWTWEKIQVNWTW